MKRLESQSGGATDLLPVVSGTETLCLTLPRKINRNWRLLPFLNALISRISGRLGHKVSVIKYFQLISKRIT